MDENFPCFWVLGEAWTTAGLSVVSINLAASGSLLCWLKLRRAQQTTRIASRDVPTESTAQHGKARQGDAVMKPRRWKSTRSFVGADQMTSNLAPSQAAIRSTTSRIASKTKQQNLPCLGERLDAGILERNPHSSGMVTRYLVRGHGR